MARAIAYYTQAGYEVLVPLGDNTKYDLVVDNGNALLRIEVKTTTSVEVKNPKVMLRTMGGNQSWNKAAKWITKENADAVFIADLVRNRDYHFPIEIVEGMSNITLWEKYDEYCVNGVT